VKHFYSLSPRYWHFIGPLIGFLSTLVGMWVAANSTNTGSVMQLSRGILASMLCAAVALILSSLGFAIYAAFIRRRPI